MDEQGLTQKKEQLEAERQALRARILDIETEITNINVQLRERNTQKELNAAEERWQEYNNGTVERKLEIYAASLIRYCTSRCWKKHFRSAEDRQIKYGKKWDILPCDKKILKENGDVYWTGKHPQGNVIRWPSDKTSRDP